MTRWHEDDLAGRLLLTDESSWRVIKLKAIAGDDDLLGRSPGEFLWSDDAYGYGDLLKEMLDKYERVGGMRDWYSEYQQEPRPLEGCLFKIAMMGFVESALVPGKRVRAWDLAATAQTGTRNPDWTVGVLMDRQSNNRFVVCDVVRLRGGPDEVEAAIINTAARDGRGVMVGLPQDPGQAGKQQTLYLTRKLVGYRVESTPETGDKATRAAPFASQVNVGNLALVRGAWNNAYIEELRSFPSGTKDDQVDASSRAFSMLGTTPIRITREMLNRI